MTLEKVLFVFMQGASTILSAFNECQFWITDNISLSLGELIIGSIVGLFILKLALSNAFGG